MINFFRRFRVQLLRENNFSKYLFYAAGEIILVVVGILLALQINNANELRKEKLKAEVYINKIVQDLEADMLNLDKLVQKGQSQRKYVREYFDFYEGSSGSLEVITDSAMQINVKANITRYLPINHGFQELVASGNLSLLRDDHKSKLIELTNAQEFYQTVVEKKITVLLEEINESEKYLDSGWSKSDFFEKFGLSQSKKDKMQGLFHRNNVLWLLYDLLGEYENRSKEIKKQTLDVLKLLRQDARSE